MNAGSGAPAERTDGGPSGDAATPKPQQARQARALDILAVVALAALVWLASPVGVGLFLGALLGFTLQPIYERLRLRGWRPSAAALSCTIAATVAISGAVSMLGVLFVTRGVTLVSSLPALLGPGGAVRTFADRALKGLGPLRLDSGDLASKLEQEAMTLGDRVAGVAAQIAGTTFGALLTLFFVTLTSYAVLRHWNTLVARLELTLPLEPRHTHALLDQFRKVGREVLWGTVVTGLAQGLLAAIGYWVTGVPQPAFFGALTAVASLVPAVGTLLVWIPLALFRIATGHVVAGLALLIYSTLFVGIVSDYVIRPRLVGSDKNVPVLLTFVSLFGGVEVFGLVGLILGPVIVTLSVAVLKTHEAAVAAARRGK